MSFLAPIAGAAARGGSNLAKRGFTGLLNTLGIGSRAPKPYTPNPRAWMDPNAPIPTVATPPVSQPGFRGAIAEGAARRATRQAAREAANKRPAFQRLIAGITSRPGIATAVGLPIAAITAGTLRDAFSGMGQPDVNYGAITVPSEREQYLSQVQRLGQTTYGMDPALQRELQIQATLNAERAAKGYENIGRKDLAEAARQGIMNDFNQIMLANRLQQQQSFSELAGTAQKEAAGLSGITPTPTEVRELASQIATDYFALPDEDKAFYAERGYDTPEKFIQGRINGEI